MAHAGPIISNPKYVSKACPMVCPKFKILRLSPSLSSMETISALTTWNS